MEKEATIILPESIGDSEQEPLLVGAEEVCGRLQQAGFEAFLVGGCVRDALLNIVPKDFDIATSAKPEEIKGLFDKAAEVTPSEAYGVMVVGIDRNKYEVATFRRDVGTTDNRRPTAVEFASLEEDASRRDFTINALYIDPVSMQLVDYVGGLEDIDTKTLRFVGGPEKRIQEDRLRVLRAIRFKNHFGFTMEPATEAATRAACVREYLKPLKAERVRDELTKILMDPSRAEALKDLENYGLLGIWLPEVAHCRGVSQPARWHSEGDVMEHIMGVMRSLPEKPSQTLVWAALLHDIGKPETAGRDSRGSTHFFGHAEAGARLAGGVLKRLRFSRRQSEDIGWLIQLHMTFIQLAQMRQAKREALLRQPLAPELHDLFVADSRGSRYEDEDARENQLAAVEEIWREFQRRPAAEREKTLKDIGVDGNYIMEALGLAQGGPAVRRALERLNIEFLEGRVKNREDAEDWLKANR